MSDTATKLYEVRRWRGDYRGVTFLVQFEVRERDWREPEPWTHYIIVGEQQIPIEWRDRLFLEPKVERWFPTSPERVCFDYMQSSLADLKWHGGITFYDLVCAVPGHRVLKAGCDYSHLFDMESGGYTVETCAAEARATIDSLHEMVPGIRAWCCHGACGPDLKPVSEMIAADGGRMRCAPCEAAVVAARQPRKGDE